MKLDRAIKMLKNKRGVKVYLGAPFSDPDPNIREKRFDDATAVAGRMCAEGIIVYSPITHYWPQAKSAGYPKHMSDTAFWIPFNDAFLEWADILAVLKIDGWDRSEGLRYEMQKMNRMKKPIMMIEK